MVADLTVLIPTHFINSAPNTKLVQRVVSELENTFPEIEGTPCMINYDMPPEKEDDHLLYFDNLKEIKTVLDLDVFYTTGGQRKSFLNIINKVQTKYFMFIEHDWVFVKQPDIHDLIGIMEVDSHINYIGFNKRSNKKVRTDFILQKSKYPNLLKTSRWSNNPYIARTSKWKESWMELVNSDKSRLKKPRRQVEYIMNKYWKDIDTKGFDKAHEEWGIYLYGNIDDSRVVQHLDGNKFI